MNPPQCAELDYIHFLIAPQQVFTCTEAARCQPEGAISRNLYPSAAEIVARYGSVVAGGKRAG